MESDLTMRVSVDAPDVGAPIKVQALLLHEGTPVEDARVRLTLVRPTRSLAQVRTPTVIARALNADRAPIAAGGKPLIGSKVTRHALKPYGERGYSAELPAPLVDGVYQFTIEAIGKACGGVFQRYGSQSLFIGRKVDPEHTTVAMKRVSAREASVTVIPRDVGGVVVGAGVATVIGAAIRGGTVVNAVNNGDGSFSFRVVWKRRITKPILRLFGDGWRLDTDLTEPPEQSETHRRHQS